MNAGPPSIPQSNYLEPAEVYRLGEKSMVVHRDCQPPTDICVKCGAPSEKVINRKFFWHHPLVYLSLFGGLLVYVILAVCLQKKMEFRVGLCAQHLKRRRMSITFGWIGFLGLFALGFYGMIEESFAIGFGGIFGALIVAIISAISAKVISPSKIDLFEGTFSGCGEDYLKKLPN